MLLTRPRLWRVKGENAIKVFGPELDVLTGRLAEVSQAERNRYPNSSALASGLSGHGFGLGPGAGRLAADLVAGDNPIVDATPYRFDRFVKRASKKAA